MTSTLATTVDDYIAALDPARARELSAVFEVVRAAVPEGLDEAIAHGMIAWSVPLSREPDTYNGEPLLYAALAAQKRHSALYLMPVYLGGPIDAGALRERWNGAKRLDVGRSCVRFRAAADLDVPLLAEALGQFDVSGFIAASREARARRRGIGASSETATAGEE